MNSLFEEMGSRGLKIVAVDMDQHAEDGNRFLERHRAKFDIADSNSDCAKALGVSAMPSSFVIDRKGYIRLAHRGFRQGDAAALRNEINDIVSE